MSLYAIFHLTTIVLYLNTPKVIKSIKTTLGFEIFLQSYKRTFFFSILMLSLFTFFEILIPKDLWQEVPTQSTKYQKFKKLNKKVGSLVSPATPLEIKGHQQAMKALNAKGLENKHFAAYLKGLEKKIDNYTELIKSLDPTNIPIPALEKNYLKNSLSEITKEHQAIKDLLIRPGKITQKELDAVISFTNKLEGLHTDIEKSFQNYGGKSPFEKVASPQQTFNQALKNTHLDLQSQVPPERHKELLKAFEEIKLTNDELQIHTATQLNTSLKNIENIKQNSKEAMVEKFENEENLINPKTLNKILEAIKHLLWISLALFILSIIQKFFKEERTPTLKRRLKRQVRRDLLKKKEYKDIHEEIKERYNIYLQAIKNLYFLESEPPPPKVLEDFLKNKYKKQEKALSYFTEVFSQSFYGQKDLQDTIIKKYRKAFKVLIKGL